ncbi:MAG: hypothetical protein GQ583_06450 [Methyloprofundus sp.]|nr:hypothetical protein [Methyloprofundus sp.]
MKNRYEQAADALILQKKQVALHNIVDRDGKPASWDNQYWIISDSKGRSVRVPFHNLVAMKNKQITVLPIYAQYDDTLRHLLMCVVLEFLEDHEVSPLIKNHVLSARHLIARVDLFSLTQDKLNQLYKEQGNVTWLHTVGVFIKWCKSKGIVRKSLIIPSVYQEDDASVILERRAGKMPDERAIWMIGAIRNEVIPKIVKEHSAQYEPYLGDALVVSCATLALGSPQRVAAEQFTLGKQRLQSKEVIFEGEEKKVHWLNWTGSKGYDDNRKHFFEAMAEYVSQVMDYWLQVGEPARILCRFYENPNQPLSFLLGDYQPKNIGDFDLNQPVNMFALGHILGFYENTD